MATLKILGILIANLPEIMRLVTLVEQRVKEGATDAKIKEDIKKLNDAFEKKDAVALNNLFNS